MVNVSIVTYHTDLQELRLCLESLTAGVVATIFVVDNSSSPSIEAFCKSYPRHIEYIPHPNDGYGAAHNVAMRRSIEQGVKYHLVLNSDVVFEPEVLSTIHGIMDTNPRIGTLQPRIVGLDGEMQYTCRALPPPPALRLRRFLPAWIGRHSRDRYLLKHLDSTKPHDIPYHQGSFMFLRVEALKETGLFDERFFMYPEDIDLTRRLHRRYLTMYDPTTTIVHAHRAASYKSGRMLWIHISNMCRYFNKWGWLHDPERREWNHELMKGS